MAAAGEDGSGIEGLTRKTGGHGGTRVWKGRCGEESEAREDGGSRGW
jgi:hypothetical protein